MRPNTRILFVFLWVLFGSAGCDHASKQVAASALAAAGSLSVANGTVRLELTSNLGVFLGLGADLPEGVREVLLLATVPLLVLWLCGHIVRARHASLPLAVGLGLLLGGGAANWFDRLLHDGSVTDFITVGVGPLRTAVFNVADLAVVSGVAILLVLTRKADASTRGPDA